MHVICNPNESTRCLGFSGARNFDIRKRRLLALFAFV